MTAASACAAIPDDATVVAGTITPHAPYLDGVPATTSGRGRPATLAADPQGNLYSDGRVRKVGLDGILVGVAGSLRAPEGFLGDGGPALAAQLTDPSTTAGRVLSATRSYRTCARSGRLTGGIPTL